MIKYACLFFLALSFSLNALAQADEVIKYYDESWKEVNKDSAFYITTFKPENNVFLVTSRIKKSNALYSTSYYHKMDFLNPAEGAYILYYESGQIKDSMYRSSGGITLSAHSYYPDGKLRATYFFDPETDKSITKGYDENERLIKGYIYEREAEYPGGTAAWRKFIQNANMTYDRKTPPGEYRFQVMFVVDESGKVRDITLVSDPGYGMGKSAIKALEKSNRWIPAVQYNELVKAYRIQPFVVIVPEGKRK